MPYSISHQQGKWYVVNDDTSEKTPADGYGTRQEAEHYQQALYANVEDAQKATTGNDGSTAIVDATGHDLDPTGAPITPDPAPTVEHNGVVDNGLVVVNDPSDGITQYPCVGADCPDVDGNPIGGQPFTASKERYVEAKLADRWFGGERLKAIGDDGSGLVGGYLVRFGYPADAQGEWFDPNCEFHLDWYGANVPVIYHHGLADQDIVEEIGRATLSKDANGIYARAQLDMDNPYARGVYNDIKQGKIGWSSGSAPHLAKIDGKGRISEWAIVEASLTPSPAAGKRTTVQALKFDTSTPAPAKPVTTIEAVKPDGSPAPAKTRGSRLPITATKSRRKTNMAMKNMDMISALEKAGIEPEGIVKVLKNLSAGMGEPDGDEAVQTDAQPADTMQADVTTDPEVAPGADAPQAAPPPTQVMKSNRPVTAKDVAAIVANAFATMKTAPAPSQAAGYQGNNPATKAGGTRITEMRTKWHKLSSEDMAFYYQMRRKARDGWDADMGFMREMTAKAIKAVNEDRFDLTPEQANYLAIKADMAVKADINSEASAALGSDWVPTLWSNVLWPRVRVDNNVAKNLEVFEMPSPSFEYPIESTDPIVYAVAEAISTDDFETPGNIFTKSTVDVDKITFTAKKLGLQVPFSTELEQDSIIPFIPQLRAQAVRAFANAIDNVILNADATTGTGNINYKGANTSAAPKSKFLYGGGNGVRYNALISAPSTNLVDMQGGAPTLQSIRQARFKLLSSLNAYGIDPKLIMYICDNYTYGQLLNIDELLTYMVNGQMSTVNTGELGATMDGSPVYPSAEMPLTDSTGYALANGTGTLGSIAVIARPAWKVGYLRQVTTDVSYIPYDDLYVLTMTARMALGKKDTAASGLIYNIALS